MDLLFLQSIWFEFLGTMSLISSAKAAGFSVGIRIGTDSELLKEVRSIRPRWVAFSCVTGIQGWAAQLAERIKAEIDPNIRILMGGAHATFFPEMIEHEPALDALCIGEGEEVIVDLLRAGNDPDACTSIPNLHIRSGDTIIRNEIRPLIEDLDSLPFMDRDSYYQYPILRDNPVKLVITSRGCPNACTFCFNHSSMKLYRGKGTYVRKRSIESVMSELDWLTGRYEVKTIRFEDDLFGTHRNWLLEFCEQYPRRFRQPFICFMRADSIDRDVVKALKQAGCYNVVIGMETGDEHLRNVVLKKRISNQQLYDAAALFHEFNLKFCTTNIFGLPGETFEQSLATVTLNQKLKPTFIWCAIFQPYPRTELGQMVLDQGLVKSLDVDAIDPNYHSRSLLNQKDIGRSVNLHHFFYVLFSAPFLLPIIIWLTRIPPNPLFILIHRISFLFIYARRWNISMIRAIREGIKTGGFTRKSIRKKVCVTK